MENKEQQNKELEKKYKPLQANVTVDLKLLFSNQNENNKKASV